MLHRHTSYCQVPTRKIFNATKNPPVDDLSANAKRQPRHPTDS